MTAIPSAAAAPSSLRKAEGEGVEGSLVVVASAAAAVEMAPWVMEQFDDDGDLVFAVHTPNGGYLTHSIGVVDALLRAHGADRDTVTWIQREEW